jgi:hypothetical protein
MDRRAHPRVAQTLPQPGQRLGVPQPKGLGVLALGLNPPRAQNALSENITIPDTRQCTVYNPQAAEHAHSAITGGLKPIKSE